MSTARAVSPRRVGATVAVAVGLWVGYLAVTGFIAVRELQSVATAARELADAARDEDWEGVDATAAELSRSASRAQQVSSGPAWALAEAVPWAGDQLRAVSASAQAAHEVAAVAPEAADEVRRLHRDGVVSAEGRIDIAAIRRLDGLAADLGARVDRAAAVLRDARSGPLLEPLDERLRDAQDQLERAARPLDAANQILPVLPGLLGAEGARTYLVAFTNPAEVRPVQGIVGAYGEVTVADGRLDLSAAGSDAEFYDDWTDPAVLGPEYVARYGTDPGLVQNVTLSAHAPDAARLLTELWVGSGRARPDGVLFLDPVGITQLLADHAPLELPGGEVVAVDDLTDVLLHEAYVRFEDDQDARKAYLTEVTTTSFAAVLEGGIAPELVAGAVDAARTGHLVVQSAHPQEQQVLESLGVAGSLPPPSDRARLYLTNADGSKLDFWVTAAVDVQPGCAPGAATRISLTLRNDAPAGIPRYMRSWLEGHDELTARRIVALYLHPEAEVVGAGVDGGRVGLASATEKGWQVKLATLDVPAGSSRTLSWDVAGQDGATPTGAWLQPLLRSEGVRSADCP